MFVSAVVHFDALCWKVCRAGKLTILLCLLFAGLDNARTQEQAPPPNDARQEFFSGEVVEVPEGRITVRRAVLGKEAETKSFLITPETKVEGKPRVKSRVTVSYRTTEEGLVAVRIIVRGR